MGARQNLALHYNIENRVNIAENGYCCRVIYLQSMKVSRTIKLPIVIQRRSKIASSILIHIYAAEFRSAWIT